MYREICDERIRLYNFLDFEEPDKIREKAYNFLLKLKIFRKKVPMQVIIERFEDFRDAKDLACDVLNN